MRASIIYFICIVRQLWASVPPMSYFSVGLHITANLTTSTQRNELIATYAIVIVLPTFGAYFFMGLTRCFSTGWNSTCSGTTCLSQVSGSFDRNTSDTFRYNPFIRMGNRHYLAWIFCLIIMRYIWINGLIHAPAMNSNHHYYHLYHS